MSNECELERSQQASYRHSQAIPSLNTCQEVRDVEATFHCLGTTEEYSDKLNTSAIGAEKYGAPIGTRPADH